MRHLIRWFDGHGRAPDAEVDSDPTIEWLRVLPFVLLHLACFTVLLVGFSWFAFGVFFVSYAIRTFGNTGGYHRLFAHRSYKTGRITQFVIACLGAAAVQRGPLWWAAHHRHHHKFSDESDDHHSPVSKSFFYSHMGWIMARGTFRSRLELIGDFAKFPELRFLDRFDLLVPILYFIAMFGVGAGANALWPELGTNGWQTLVWGGVLATVFLYHVTFSINSLSHKDQLGRRRYVTADHSRNIWWLAPLTFGEAWHNNHHHFPASSRLGFFWWEVDIGYYVIRTLNILGLAHDLRQVPPGKKAVTPPADGGDAPIAEPRG